MKTLRSAMAPPKGLNLREEAAWWLLREEEGRLGEGDRARLDGWLAADPLHRRAYDAAKVACEAAGRHAADPEVMALRQAALASGPERRAPAWRIAAAIAAGMVTIAVGSATFTAVEAPASSRLGAAAARLAPTLPAGAALYRTDVGERSTVVLPDGSVATLNTDSVLKVAYARGERGVRLLRGQAMFEVAKNRDIPFRVYAGDRRITAVGTVFDVRLDGERVKVALVEGVVRVSPAAPEPGRVTPQVTLNAGEVLQAEPAAPTRVQVADIRRATSWKEGVVVFDDAPLVQAVAEMNRYTTRPLKLADPASGAFRVSGVFKTGDPERFAGAMAEVFPLTVARAWDGSPELRPKER